MELYRSLSNSPTDHCELEKYFLTAHPEKDVLLFYINKPSVIVGRNQAVEAEVNISFCNKHHIEIVKRISGGGTVYHDEGNINYAFIVSKLSDSVLDLDFASPILAGLSYLGISATVGARKELLVHDKKISGTASHISGNRILFHGTLLHQTNLENLTFALHGDESLRGKKVASIPSPVINLSTITNIEETTFDFLTRLLSFFEMYYETKTITLQNNEPLNTTF